MDILGHVVAWRRPSPLWTRMSPDGHAAQPPVGVADRPALWPVHVAVRDSVCSAAWRPRCAPSPAWARDQSAQLQRNKEREREWLTEISDIDLVNTCIRVAAAGAGTATATAVVTQEATSHCNLLPYMRDPARTGRQGGRQGNRKTDREADRQTDSLTKWVSACNQLRSYLLSSSTALRSLNSLLGQHFLFSFFCCFFFWWILFCTNEFVYVGELSHSAETRDTFLVTFWGKLKIDECYR